MGRTLREYLPPPSEKMIVQVIARLPAVLKARIVKFCMKEDVQQNEFIRASIEAYLDGVSRKRVK